MATAVNAANTGPAPSEVLHGLRVALAVPLIFAVLGVLAMLPALRRRVVAPAAAPLAQEEAARG
ncbi:hypothetical protein ACFQ10_37920 [Streptomyces indonesiensis]